MDELRPAPAAATVRQTLPVPIPSPGSLTSLSFDQFRRVAAATGAYASRVCCANKREKFRILFDFFVRTLGLWSVIGGSNAFRGLEFASVNSGAAVTSLNFSLSFPHVHSVRPEFRVGHGFGTDQL